MHDNVSGMVVMLVALVVILVMIAVILISIWAGLLAGYSGMKAFAKASSPTSAAGPVPERWKKIKGAILLGLASFILFIVAKILILPILR